MVFSQQTIYIINEVIEMGKMTIPELNQWQDTLWNPGYFNIARTMVNLSATDQHNVQKWTDPKLWFNATAPNTFITLYANGTDFADASVFGSEKAAAVALEQLQDKFGIDATHPFAEIILENEQDYYCNLDQAPANILGDTAPGGLFKAK